jgi:peptidase M28-like protein
VRRSALGVLATAGALVAVATASFSASLEPSVVGLAISSVEDIAADLALLDCAEESRYDAVSRLFGRAGAPPAEVSEFSRRQVRNLVVRKPGASEETIVIGAHYDKTELGCGAIDNWTGIVAMAHLYSSLRDGVPAKSLLFVAFDDEEKGLHGSNAMVQSIPRKERARYCAMINLDSLGQSRPQVLDNVSSTKLRKLAAELAESMGMPFDHARLEQAGADSTSFLRRGIPAVTIHGMSAEALRIIHTPGDQPSKVNATSVYLGYRLALAVLTRLDGLSCDAYR